MKSFRSFQTRLSILCCLACSFISLVQGQSYQACTTSSNVVHLLAMNESGNIQFVEYNGDGDIESINENNSDLENIFSNDGRGRRYLRHLEGWFQSFVKVNNGRRLTQEQAMRKNNRTAVEFQARACLCNNPITGNKIEPKNDANDEEEQETEEYVIRYCPEQYRECQVPLSNPDDPTFCYSTDMQLIVARNAWPLVLLWYFGLTIICCCTIHGHTAKEYLKSWTFPNYNINFIERMLTENPSPPINRWSWWSWQSFRFEQGLMAQVQWMWRHQEYMRQLRRRQQGIHPQFEMKTKRYIPIEPSISPNDETFEADGENDSIDEPTCTICFAPLEEGDRVGDLACEHIYHVDCLKGWLQRRNACPLCSVSIAQRRGDHRQDPTESEPESRSQTQ